MYKKEANHFIRMVLSGISIAIGSILFVLTILFHNILLFYFGTIIIIFGICVFAFSKLVYSQPTETFKTEENNSQIDYMKMIEEEIENEEIEKNSDSNIVLSIISNLYSEDKNG